MLMTMSPAAAAAADPPDPVAPPNQEQAAARVVKTFRVASLNILGSNHTRGADKKRTVKTARLLRDRRVAVAGLQEVQADQLGWLKDRLPGYRIWPGSRYGAQGLRLQIAWKKRRFALRDHGSITTTFSHFQRPIPWVRLEDRQSGRVFSVIDIHNSPSGQEAARDAATRQQVDLYKRLRTNGPVLLMGDANERKEWFCKVTRATDARAANGGQHVDGCIPPTPTYVDWLMGGGSFDWRRYRAEETTVSDHKLHSAVVRWG